MTWTKEAVAATIDHAVLKPECTDADVRQHAAMCRTLKVASMCVRPNDVALASELLADSGVMVSCVLSFPHGADRSEIKIFQAKQAIEDGVAEIDMVMPIGRFLSGDMDYVKADIQGVAAVAKATGVVLKVILETAFLTADQIEQACLLCEQAGAHFVKTSTGFGPGAATPEAIEVMVRTVGGRLGVKASGGIRTWEAAVAFLDQGATRLGMGASDVVLAGGVSAGRY